MHSEDSKESNREHKECIEEKSKKKYGFDYIRPEDHLTDRSNPILDDRPNDKIDDNVYTTDNLMYTTGILAIEDTINEILSTEDIKEFKTGIIYALTDVTGKCTSVEIAKYMNSIKKENPEIFRMLNLSVLNDSW
ncbi:hypothetical protein NEOKW01_1857 [Nematocida sp. AWRm80]|nr:hypothetical protein NEOKW01_1857 [Nematocida sp. AWRm80]